MNTAAHYRLAKGTAIRPERFGALVYRYDNRRLYFIHSHAVAAFVAGLDGAMPLSEAVAAFVADNGLAGPARDTLVQTVERLEGLGIIQAVAGAIEDQC